METQKRGAIPVEAETTEELLGALESSTRGETGLRAGDEPDPAESAGGMLPHVQNPCCSHLVPKYGCGPFHQIINHCGAIRSAELSFEWSERKPNSSFHKVRDLYRLGSLLRANHFLRLDPLIELIIGD